MLRIQPIASAKDAESYYAHSDGGYYLKPEDVDRRWLGKGAKELGLADGPDFEQFKRLLHGLDPHTGEQLTARLNEDRLAGWDVNVHCPKGVTTAAECGDTRIATALWAAAEATIADMEAYATTRVRKDNRQEDRRVGNLVGFGLAHYETRPTKDDRMPDWHRHLHLVIFNLCRDEVEGEWKAVKFRPIMDLRKYFDRRFNLHFSQGVADLGYEIETCWKSDGKGGRSYQGWDIKGIPGEVIERFSRRTQEIDALESEIVGEIRRRDPDAPATLSAVAKDKLGGTSRLHKRKDLSLGDYRSYWLSRLTPQEKDAIGNTIIQASRGLNPRPLARVGTSVQYAIDHVFNRRSVVDRHDFAVAAMERCMGAGRADDIMPAAVRQGLLVKGDDTTTREVLAESERIVGFARQSRGCWKPLGDPDADRSALLAGLSDEQAAVVRHIWESRDQVILVRGAPGTGKTRTLRPALAGIGKPGILIAPSADASRSTLRKEGFEEADTVARFLIDDGFAEKARDGYVVVDEAGMVSSPQADGIFRKAARLNARVILVGDRKQHGSVERGTVLHDLETFAGLPVPQLTRIYRQTHEGYNRGVSQIERGDFGAACETFDGLGWLTQADGHAPLIDRYLEAIDEKRADGKPKSVLVICPTHAEGDELTAGLRRRLKERGLISGEDVALGTLKSADWTPAERGDWGRYDGSEVIQFHQNSGAFRKGSRVSIEELRAANFRCKPEHFGVYIRQDRLFAVGDAVRATAGGVFKGSKRRFDNGFIFKIDGFTEGGDLRLTGGRIIDRQFGHFRHAWVHTSPSTQSKSEDVVLVAMNRRSAGAIGAEQALVSASRGREEGRIFTDMPLADFIAAAIRMNERKSAYALFSSREVPVEPPKIRQTKLATFIKRVTGTYRYLRNKAAEAISEPIRWKETAHAR
ncbi:MobF family relaxase [Singulisphaera sp. PoT]|uniref:MobF family relaxase n=1 Tax=Singulisphaera sp. PoT TaxID=3411797 RepID=UPI003BF5D142